MKKRRFIYLAVVPLSLWSGTALAGLNDGLVAHYLFNGDANDASGRRNNGTVNGATSTTDNRFSNLNSAYRLDGVTDYLSLPMTASRDFSVAFWVRTAKNAPSAGTNGVGGWKLVVDYNDTTVNSNSLVRDSNWHLIVATRNQNSGAFQLYVDGVLQAAGKGNNNLLQTAPGIGVGYNPYNISGNRQRSDGMIDDVRIYNRALSNGEIQQLYADTTPNPTLNPDLTGDYNKGVQDGISQGIARCKTDPVSCGITVDSTPTTQQQLDVAKQAGIDQCKKDPASCNIFVSITGTGENTTGTPNGTAQCNGDNTTSCSVTLVVSTTGDVVYTSGGDNYNAGKQDGIKQCQTTPSSCKISVPTDRSRTEHASYNPKTGELHIPVVDEHGVLGNTQSYEVYLLQNPSDFTFDLDLTRVNQRASDSTGGYDKGVQDGISQGIAQCKTDPLSCGITVASTPATKQQLDAAKQAGIDQCKTNPLSCDIVISSATGQTPTGNPLCHLDNSNACAITFVVNNDKQASTDQCKTNPASCNSSTGEDTAGPKNRMAAVSDTSAYNAGKQEGIKQCQTTPSSCGIAISTDSSGTGHATYSPKTSELYIPVVDAPGVFGDLQSYEVYLLQKPGAFTFELDLTRVKQY